MKLENLVLMQFILIVLLSLVCTITMVVVVKDSEILSTPLPPHKVVCV